MNVSLLKEHPDNPRIIKTHKFQKTIKSVKEFGKMLNVRPIVVNKDLVIIGGHMRYKACIEAGYTEVPVMIADFTPEEEREFMIKDNVNYGEFDFDVLANRWDYSVDKFDTWGVDGFNFGTKADLLTLDENDDKPLEIKKTALPKITDSGFVRIEFVILEEQKKDIMRVVNEKRGSSDKSVGQIIYELIVAK